MRTLGGLHGSSFPSPPPAEHCAMAPKRRGTGKAKKKTTNKERCAQYKKRALTRELYALLDSSPVLLELYCLWADPASRGEEAPELLPLMARFPFDDEVERDRAMSPDRSQHTTWSDELCDIMWLPGEERGRMEDWWKNFALQPEQLIGKSYFTG